MGPNRRDAGKGHNLPEGEVQKILSFELAILALLACCVLQNSAAAQHPIEAAKRILFLGDSITYDGKYIAHVEAEWRLKNPNRKFEIINCGLPSETVSGLSEEGHAGGKFPRPDLHERLDRVIQQIQPDSVVACYGMNDGIYLPLSEERFAAFQNGIERLRERVGRIPAPVLHLTPAVFDALPIRDRVAPAGKVTASQPYEEYDGVLERYSQWLLSKKGDGWLVIDTHQAMLAAINEGRTTDPEFTFARDGVHPNPDGHVAIAFGLLKGLGYSDQACSLIKSEYAEENSKRSQLFKLIHSRQKLLTDAWLTKTGHKRPMTAGKPLDEALARAAEIDKEINRLVTAQE